MQLDPNCLPEPLHTERSFHLKVKCLSVNTLLFVFGIFFFPMKHVTLVSADERLPVMPRFRFCRCFVLGCDKVVYQWRTLCEAVGLLLKDLKVPYYAEFILPYQHF